MPQVLADTGTTHAARASHPGSSAGFVNRGGLARLAARASHSRGGLWLNAGPEAHPASIATTCACRRQLIHMSTDVHVDVHLVRMHGACMGRDAERPGRNTSRRPSSRPSTRGCSWRTRENTLEPVRSCTNLRTHACVRAHGRQLSAARPRQRQRLPDACPQRLRPASVPSRRHACPCFAPCGTRGPLHAWAPRPATRHPCPSHSRLRMLLHAGSLARALSLRTSQILP